MSGDEDLGPWKSALMVASVGIELAVAIGIGYLVGDWLDEKLDTRPWLMYLFLTLGSAAGFKGFWRTARRYWPREDE
ncbi:MAG: AtpZ/AtpI family protein [Deltaproteobacteria bacterium]|nr:AtpZ/AtpI family protein [Deltaproteobacteria bacterium]